MGVFGKGERTASKKSVLREELATQGGNLAFLFALFASFKDWSCQKLIFLDLRKDLFSDIRIAVLESLPPGSSRRYWTQKFWTFAGLTMDVCMRFLLPLPFNFLLCV